jgi:hypothetical protein
MNPLRAWNRFWFGPISARPLGAFRLVFGLIVLANLALLTVDLEYWFTDAGLLQGAEARAVAAPLRYSPMQWYQSPATVRAFFAATAAVAVLFTIGWQTRLMGVLLYLGMLSIHHRNILSNSGPDGLLVIMLFFLMLSPSGAAYSLDARRATRRRGAPAEPLIVPWAQRLIQVQLCLIYFVTSVWKCNGSTWLNGTAIHYVLNNTEVGRFRLDPLTQYPLAINALSLAGLLTEFALAFFLWFRATRTWTICAGLGLHFGVLFMVNVPIFGELMTACYLTFLAPDELDGLLRRINPRNWFGRPRRESGTRSILGRVDEPSCFQKPHTAETAPEEAGAAPGAGERPDRVASH